MLAPRSYLLYGKAPPSCAHWKFRFAWRHASPQHIDSHSGLPGMRSQQQSPSSRSSTSGGALRQSHPVHRHLLRPPTSSCRSTPVGDSSSPRSGSPLLSSVPPHSLRIPSGYGSYGRLPILSRSAPPSPVPSPISATPKFKSARRNCSIAPASSVFFRPAS